MQSRAELHKARLDALNATQRHNAAATQTTQVGASPMTQRAIADLTAAQLLVAANKHRVVQTSAPAAAIIKAPATEATQPSTQVRNASAIREASAPPVAVAAAVKAAAPAAAAAAAHRINAQQQAVGNNPPVVAAAAGGRLEVSAGTKLKSPASPSSSRQAPKRRRSRSVSPSLAGSRGCWSQAGSQRQVASSSRRPTRLAMLSVVSRHTCVALAAGNMLYAKDSTLATCYYMLLHVARVMSNVVPNLLQYHSK